MHNLLDAIPWLVMSLPTLIVLVGVLKIKAVMG